MQLTKQIASLWSVRSSGHPPSSLFSNTQNDMFIPILNNTPPSNPLSMTDVILNRRLALISSCLALTLPPPAFALTKSSKNASKTKSIPNFPKNHPGLTIGDVSQGVLCEVFVDFTCPYSRKTFATLSDLFTGDGKRYLTSMAVTFQNVLQPWHHQSLWLHESSFAVKLLFPTVELAYWKALFEIAPRFYDKEVYGLTRAEFYNAIAEFAANVVVEEGSGDGHDREQIKTRLMQYLVPPLQKGGDFPPEAAVLLGSSPTDDENALFPLTRQVVKFQRKRGVHVTPTIFFNGIEQGQISSGWSVDDWTAFLDGALGFA